MEKLIAMADNVLDDIDPNFFGEFMKKVVSFILFNILFDETLHKKLCLIGVLCRENL